MNIGVLTGGGDCPGLNAVVRAIVYKGASRHGFTYQGIHEGWKGLLDGGTVKPLTVADVENILQFGGTILKTSRCNPLTMPDGIKQIKANILKYKIDALMVIGGVDTLGVAAKLHTEGVKLVAVPKTIDNNVWGTDRTFGFDTAVNVATEAIDRIRTTAEAHNRIFVVEVMGRDAGWIAIESGIAGGATMILIPEFPVDVDRVIQNVKHRHDRGAEFSVIVVAEGTRLKIKGEEPKQVTIDSDIDEFGHARLGGVADRLADLIRKNAGYDCRSVRLGHIQRGGSPSAFDRVLATRYGIVAVELVRLGEFGNMAALQGMRIVRVPLSEVAKSTKTVDPELYQTAEVFFG
ncbi:MAG: ATP-dependent 6-phosphofructokinase [Candidatus Zixiibacteriota bacterium]